MALVISEIKLYELLKAKIGEKEAEAFIEILEQKVENKLQEKTNVFAIKEDLAKIEGKLLSTIGEAKVDIIKWLIATAITIVAVIISFARLSH
ncbi:hypothetical protein ACFOW1_08735 [Parasediminibacterium paludis]|uniref:DUF1640 domain-containing protein n=1 Tax=Parasediminibacterium paludis TaxID=908966 RepID=A0ABV8PYB1_9BACT